MNLLDIFSWNRELRRELREHLAASAASARAPLYEEAEGLISTTDEFVPSVDTAHYSVRRYDAALNRYVYAPWDWSKARTVFACNVAKASDGIAGDTFYDEHVATMKAQGIQYGSYHFFRDNTNAITQEQVFTARCEESGGYGFVAVIDCEALTGTHSAYMTKLGSFVNELRKHWAGPLWVYSRASFWDPIWIGAGRPVWTASLDQWQAIYPTALQTDTAKRAILYDGWLPTFPTYDMHGLGTRHAWQWTPSIPNSMIPGHNMVKAVEDGNLWRRATIPVPMPPPLTLEEQVADHEVRITELETRVAVLEMR